jgi:AraC-type DNA-binding domain-containing proteins
MYTETWKQEYANLFITDAENPFISRNDPIWNYLEPELTRRLCDIDTEDSFGAMVRRVLIELLPGGESSIEQVAKKLMISKRTLQRKLNVEKTTFQKQLNLTRESLSKYYIMNTDMTSSDIAYLLGYQDLNSFRRAFHLWTGMNISEYSLKLR